MQPYGTGDLLLLKIKYAAVGKVTAGTAAVARAGTAVRAGHAASKGAQSGTTAARSLRRPPPLQSAYGPSSQPRAATAAQPRDYGRVRQPAGAAGRRKNTTRRRANATTRQAAAPPPVRFGSSNGWGKGIDNWIGGTAMKAWNGFSTLPGVRHAGNFARKHPVIAGVGTGANYVANQKENHIQAARRGMRDMGTWDKLGLAMDWDKSYNQLAQNTAGHTRGHLRALAPTFGFGYGK